MQLGGFTVVAENEHKTKQILMTRDSNHYSERIALKQAASTMIEVSQTAATGLGAPLISQQYRPVYTAVKLTVTN